MRACGFGSLAIFCVMVGMSFSPRLAFQAGGFLTMLMALILVYKAWEAPTKNHRHTELWLYLPKEQRPPEGHAQWAIATAMRETYLDLCALDDPGRHRDVGAGADVSASRPLARIAARKKDLSRQSGHRFRTGAEFPRLQEISEQGATDAHSPGRHVMSISKRQVTTPAIR